MPALGRVPAEEGGLDVAPPALTPPDEIAWPPLLPPEPDGALLELQASREMVLRATMPRKGWVTKGFIIWMTPVQGGIMEVAGGEIPAKNSLPK